MNWLDIILPYRFWLRRKHAIAAKNIEREYLPKPYNTGILLPVYRKKIKELNKKNFNRSENFNASKNLKKSLQDTNDGFLKNTTPFIVAGTEAAIFLGQDVYQSYQAVDEYVYEGMSRLSGENIDNIADLSSKVQSYEHDFWSGLTDAGVNKVGGHIGEAYAIDNLQNKGLDVEWAKNSNQEGWDLLVSGHEMNVKTVADANSLSEHFKEYPDIPAIIPGDATNIPEGAINIGSEAGIEELNQALLEGRENLVVVDPSLSGEEIMNQAEGASDLLSGATDIFDTYVPIITAGLSSYREVKLLYKGHTSIKTAAKNIGLDIIGSGGGGAAGALSGGAIGSLLGPIGTVIGGIAGGISGAIYGRKASDAAKKIPFKNAYDAYNAQLYLFNKDKHQSIERTDNAIKEFKFSQIVSLNVEKQKSKNEISNRTNKMIEFRRKQYDFTTSELNLLKNQSSIEIDNYINILNSKFQKRNKWKAIFLPEAEDFAFNKVSHVLHEMRDKLLSIDTINTNQNAVDLLNLFGKFGVLKEKVLQFIMEKELLRYKHEAENRNKIKSIMNTLAKKRYTTITKISEFITEETKKTHKYIKQQSKYVLNKMELVNIEKQKLAMN